jgi:MinD superfamily P-loop ATPase
MQIMASTGVKGGVGKSTFAILLAFKILKQKKKIVLCDCDVECPNDYLILNQKSKNPKPIYQKFPVLNEEKCKKCGLCSKVCREHAVFCVENDYPKFILDLCTSCGACWISCPNNAIEKKKEIAGEFFVNKIKNNFWLVTGKSKAGISETGPIVREVKERAIKLAKKIDADYLITDTSPGAHCNVIQALLNSDKVYAVTEPTPLGAYDLGVILELTKKLNLSTEIVLNKADVGSRREIEKIAKKFKSKISIEIPYSEKLIKAYCTGKLEKMVNLI